MTRIFVYGSLKRGFALHGILIGQRFIAEATTIPAFRLYDVGCFPAMIRDANGIAIRGELYEVDDTGLRRLDQVESEGRLYERVEIDLQDQGTAMAYLFLQGTHDLQEIGDCWHGPYDLGWE